jgi:hypothetical protein
MASNSITRDHHNMRRTVSLNGNKISNDGGDEGLSIADDGDATFSAELNIVGALKIEPPSDVVDCSLTLKSTFDGTVDNYIAGVILFQKEKDEAGANNDLLGTILFKGVNSAEDGQDYAQIQSHISEAGDGDEAGKLTLDVHASDGSSSSMINGLTLEGASDAAGVVNVTIGAGAASMTTIAGNLNIPAETNLYLDGGGDTYIREHASDTVRYVVGNDAMMVMTETGATGNTVSFNDSGVGFTQFTVTFDATDTIVTFQRDGNKAHLTMTADVTDVHLQFPNVSCNCQLIVLQDGTGSWDVTNWKTTDQATGNASTVIWSGGSAPGLTETADKLDILSFYWDNVNHKAYGVASTNF